MLTAHKIALNPNNEQATYFFKAAGTARFSYNWALAEWSSQYEAHKIDPTQPKPSEQVLRKQLNSIKRIQFPWMLEVTKNAPQMAIINLGKAFENFFKGRAKYPTFKKKGINDRFTLSNEQFHVENSKIHIPKLGLVNMHEELRFKGKIMSATISRVANHWFVSITVETEPKPPSLTAENQSVVGVDLGVLTLATLSTGKKIEGPKAHSTLLKQLKRQSKRLSRKVKGSNNRKKAQAKLAKLHARIANIRKDSLHKLTTDLTRQFRTIVIEDLNVKGMVKNRRLARVILDMGLFEFRRQLIYKAEREGGVVLAADRWFPSSKLCSSCGFKLEKLSLSVRKWTCPQCGKIHDRDENAAINLKNLAVSSTVTVCGEKSSGFLLKQETKLISVKQKSNSKLT